MDNQSDLHNGHTNQLSHQQYIRVVSLPDSAVLVFGF